MVETRESCLEQSKNFNPRTKRCIETEASCRAKGKVYNERTRRCNKKKTRSNRTRSNSSASKSKSKSPSPETCPICLEPLDFKSRKNLFSGINCDHFFHKNCIKSWCKNNFDCKCPLCRQLLFRVPSPPTALGRRNGPPYGVTVRSRPRILPRSRARVINNATRRFSPHSPDGPPPDLIVNLTSEGNSPDGPPPE